MKETSLYKKPYQSLLILAICIFASEIAIMLFLPFFPNMPAGLRAVIDASLLIILSLPALYFFGFRPLMRYISEHRRIEDKLQRVHAELERRVSERTKELAKANEVLRAEITARKRTEEELTGSLKEKRAILEGILDVAYMVDLDWKFIDWNKALMEKTGYSAQELKGMPALGIIAEEDRARGEQGIREVFERGFASRELQLSTKDGRKIFYNFSGAVIKGAQGNVRGFVGIGSDVTEHKRVEEELKESEFKYRTLVEQIPAVTYIISGGENSSLIYVSPQIQKILGFSPEEYKSEPDLWRRQLHPDDHDRVLAELVSSRVSGKKFISEYRMLSKDGRIVYFHNEAIVVRDSEQKNIFLQGVMYDITAHKKADENLRKANTELESRIAARTQELYAVNKTLQKEISECRQAEDSLKEKMADVNTFHDTIVEIEQKIIELKKKLNR